MEHLVAELRAVAEPTRLRLLFLCAQGELTVGELVGILGQSQPRVSRHLKLLCDAGLLDRFKEGSFVLYRLARRGPGVALARALLGLVPETDPVMSLDRDRLAALKRQRAETASAYFRANAPRWDKIRSLYVAEPEVEAALLAILSPDGIGDFLDVGTGTGRMLELFGPRAEHAVGIDLSREMLAVARVNLERAGLRNWSLRRGDMYQLPLANETFDAAVFHQVLHYAEDPARALQEAGRVLKPGGRLAIVDFAPHDVEALRAEQAHRRLGFADEEVVQWCTEAGFEPGPIAHLPGQPLTVTLWSARRRLASPRQPLVSEPSERAGVDRVSS